VERSTTERHTSGGADVTRTGRGWRTGLGTGKSRQSTNSTSPTGSLDAGDRAAITGASQLICQHILSLEGIEAEVARAADAR
jgi:hypothetical protein